jgi:hypothetical protein
MTWERICRMRSSREPSIKRGCNILYIKQFPPLYEVERGKKKGGEYIG